MDLFWNKGTRKPRNGLLFKEVCLGEIRFKPTMYGLVCVWKAKRSCEKLICLQTLPGNRSLQCISTGSVFLSNLPAVTQNPLHNVIRPWIPENCQWNCSCTAPSSKWLDVLWTPPFCYTRMFREAWLQIQRVFIGQKGVIYKLDLLLNVKSK